MAWPCASVQGPAWANTVGLANKCNFGQSIPHVLISSGATEEPWRIHLTGNKLFGQKTGLSFFSKAEANLQCCTNAE